MELDLDDDVVPAPAPPEVSGWRSALGGEGKGVQINTAVKQQSFRDEKADRPPPGSARPNTGRTDRRGGSKQERRGHLILGGRDAQIEEGERVAGGPNWLSLRLSS